ncbi:MAG: 50S ribosomal protein L3 [Myxococcota bacterium]
MNTNLGLIGKKLGNTQIFNEDGSVTPVTVVEAGPCVVVGKRSEAKHGYTALQLGFGKRREKLVNKPEAGAFKKLEIDPPEVVREFRVSAEDAEKFEVGQEIKVSDVFEVGQRVDIAGVSKGRGFAGVIKRHNFHGAGTVGHGTHEYKRHGGSIGMNMTPGRTLANQKMPGRYGGKRSTLLGIKVARVMDEEGLVLLAGGVPGPRSGLVTVRKAVKRKGKGTPAS